MEEILKQYRWLHEYNNHSYLISFVGVDANNGHLSRVSNRAASGLQKAIRIIKSLIALFILVFITTEAIAGGFADSWSNNSKILTIILYIFLPLLLIAWINSNISQVKLIGEVGRTTSDLYIDFANKRITNGTSVYSFQQITGIETVVDRENSYIDRNQSEVLQKQHANNNLVYLKTDTNEQILLMIVANGFEQPLDEFIKQFKPLIGLYV